MRVFRFCEAIHGLSMAAGDADTNAAVAGALWLRHGNGTGSTGRESSRQGEGITHKMAWGSKICVGMLVFVGYFQSWCTGEVLSFDKARLDVVD